MTDWASPRRDQESWDSAGRAETSGRRRWRTVPLALLAAMLIPALAGGCEALFFKRSKVIEVDQSSFKRVVLDSKQPVLVNFYKDG